MMSLDKIPSLIRFQPVYFPKVWGGEALHTKLHRPLDASLPIGESWELCDREEAISTVLEVWPPTLHDEWEKCTLHELWKQWRVPIFGPKHATNQADEFPLLIKILDAREDLSVQVHPPESTFQKTGAPSKTEWWYVLDAEPESRLYAGFSRRLSPEEFLSRAEDGRLVSDLHVLHPKAGESLFLPSGRIHALGGGLLIAEVQQNCNTTYRVFDWGRVGFDGQPRELHLKESLECVDFEDLQPAITPSIDQGNLVRHPSFCVTMKQGQASESIRLGKKDEFHIIMAVDGELQVDGLVLKRGEFVLIPCGSDARMLPTRNRWLEITIP